MDDYGPRLARWLTGQLTARGYDLSVRGGGRTKFADDTGISRATISRILSGHGSNDVAILNAIADRLGIPRITVLIEAGLITDADLNAPRPPITDAEAARELGLDDRETELFISYLDTIRRTRPAD